MKVQLPTSGIARLTGVLAGSRRRKAAVIVGLMMISAAVFDPAGVENTSVVLSPDESAEDEFLQIEMMLAELEQESISAPAATAQQSPVNVSDGSTITTLIIPGSTDDSTTKSEAPVAISATPPLVVPTHGVSYQDSRSDSTHQAAPSDPARTESDSRSRARPRSIHLTGTIDPL